MQPRKRCDFCNNDCLWKNVEDMIQCFCGKMFRCCMKCKESGKLPSIIEINQEHQNDKHKSIDLV